MLQNTNAIAMDGWMDAIADSNLFFLEMNLKIFSLVSISGKSWKEKNVCTGCPHLRRLLAVPPFQFVCNENGIEDLVT